MRSAIDNGISVLGSTGSVGRQTLEVARRLGFKVHALSAAGSNIDLLIEQTKEFLPQIAAVSDSGAADLFISAVKKDSVLSREYRDGKILILSGDDGLCAAASQSKAGVTVIAVSGAAGLPAVVSAIEAKKTVALANKEALVMAGRYIMELSAKNSVTIIPVDSEHSAIFQCLKGHNINEIKRLILTASGGPFRGHSLKSLVKITPEQASSHPIWNMGKKISIDSATMANKGLELIEAVRLFNIPPEKIKILIHPQSIVHSMIQMKDGAVYAQLSRPDMRLPIYKALHWPSGKLRGKNIKNFGRMDFNDLTLEFFRPDFKKFPMLDLAYKAVKKGGLYPCVYNAANEEAVAAFLEGRIGFLDIVSITQYVLDMDWNQNLCGIASVMETDKLARKTAVKKIKELK